MHVLWYTIIALMLSVYVVLDGFDFGAGILHLFVARTDNERRQVLNAIGPFWDGNEVWLIAAGGLLVFAFPRVYAAGFSGFYLPLMISLWLLVGRGLSIEFRSKEENPLWRAFWDTCFFASSLLMSVVLGAALGNVIRGVPLLNSGYFSDPLFTNFKPGQNPGVLDWYTVSVGVFAALTLAGHGALFLVIRTTDKVKERCLAAARILWPLIVLTGAAVTFLTWIVRPQIYQALIARPWTWLLPCLIAGGLITIFWSLAHAHAHTYEEPAFIGSVAFILGLLCATAAGMYPNMLISTIKPDFSLTAYNAATGSSALSIGLIWWAPAVVLVAAYFFNLFRVFRGRIEAGDNASGHY